MAATGYLAGVKRLHHNLVLKRREDVIARKLAGLLPAGLKSGLDVGCGDGVIAQMVAAESGAVDIQGVEVLDRETCAIPYRLFDGHKLPFDDAQFDYVSFVDVLHHTENVQDLIAEAARVSTGYVLIKDHFWSNRIDYSVLKFMDWVGNRAYGVRLIYNYLKKDTWQDIFQRSQLQVVSWDQHIGLYPPPFSLLFEREKHFVALLRKVDVGTAEGREADLDGLALAKS